MVTREIAPASLSGGRPPCYDTRRVRCFVAVEVPSGVRDELVAVQTALRRRLRRADLRWATPDQLHLTLKFLGAVPDDRVAAVSVALDQVGAGAAPLALTAAGLGAFPSLGSARVIWAGITAGSADAAALAAGVDQATASLGFPPETRPFRCHLTLGRVRSPGGGRGLGEAVKAVGNRDFGSWIASELILYESRLRPTGALHVPVSRHALRGVRR